MDGEQTATTLSTQTLIRELKARSVFVFLGDQDDISRAVLPDLKRGKVYTVVIAPLE